MGQRAGAGGSPRLPHLLSASYFPPALHLARLSLLRAYCARGVLTEHRGRSRATPPPRPSTRTTACRSCCRSWARAPRRRSRARASSAAAPRSPGSRRPAAARGSRGCPPSTPPSPPGARCPCLSSGSLPRAVSGGPRVPGGSGVTGGWRAGRSESVSRWKVLDLMIIPRFLRPFASRLGVSGLVGHCARAQSRRHSAGAGREPGRASAGAGSDLGLGNPRELGWGGWFEPHPFLTEASPAPCCGCSGDAPDALTCGPGAVTAPCPSRALPSQLGSASVVQWDGLPVRAAFSAPGPGPGLGRGGRRVLWPLVPPARQDVPLSCT